MKFAKSLPALTSLLLGGGLAHADPATDASLQRMQTIRDRMIANAVQPIDLRYRTALDQLLRTTMQKGDLDGAIKIREAIAAAATTAAPPDGPLGNAIGAKRFAGTKWRRARLEHDFDADGTYRNLYPGIAVPLGKWRATSATTALVTGPKGEEMKFTWNPDDTITEEGGRVVSRLPVEATTESKAPTP